jgi:hypothetical protein
MDLHIMLYISNISRENKNGFYSLFFLLLTNYIYCKKNNISHVLDSSNWLFKYQVGWEDYFQPFSFVRNPYIQDVHNVQVWYLLEEYPIFEYIEAIRETYIYNNETKRRIQEYKSRRSIIDKTYDSIFIRRGDKLCYESQYIPTEKYMEKLLEKNPHCRKLWIQTDDYNVITDAEHYVATHGLEIEIMTLCQPSFKGGMVIFNNINHATFERVSTHGNQFEGNKEYLSQALDDIRKIKPIEDMSPSEIYEHTMAMLIGIDIVLHSNICVCDYFSNVSRFIKLAHNNYNNVYDVYRPDAEIALNTVRCPALTCSFYPGL